MGEVVTRVAEAVLKELRTRKGFRHLLDEIDDDTMTEIKAAIGRSGIEAMRKPTEKMILAGESAASLGIGKPVDDEALPHVWHRMVDEALR